MFKYVYVGRSLAIKYAVLFTIFLHSMYDIYQPCAHGSLIPFVAYNIIGPFCDKMIITKLSHLDFFVSLSIRLCTDWLLEGVNNILTPVKRGYLVIRGDPLSILPILLSNIQVP